MARATELCCRFPGHRKVTLQEVSVTDTLVVYPTEGDDMSAVCHSLSGWLCRQGSSKGLELDNENDVLRAPGSSREGEHSPSQRLCFFQPQLLGERPKAVEDAGKQAKGRE